LFDAGAVWYTPLLEEIAGSDCALYVLYLQVWNCVANSRTVYIFNKPVIFDDAEPSDERGNKISRSIAALVVI
jgi:hypothetical protein